MARVDLGQFFKEETTFLLTTLDLQQLMLDHGYVYSKNGATRKEPLYKKNGLQLGVAIGNKGFYVWNDVTPGVKHNVPQHTIGFLMLENGYSAKDAFAEARKLALERHPGEYKMFVEQFIKLEGANAVPQHIRKTIGALANVSPVSPKKRVINIPIQPESAEEKEFDFEIATDFSLLFDRGITIETIKHPIFINTFGNAEGKFGGKSDSKIIAEELKEENNPHLVYQKHLIIPYRNLSGKVVSLEAKNRFTEEGYLSQIERTIKSGDNLSKVRRNPSKFYVGSSKGTSFWISNIPENPTTIFVTEQPIDALSFFQINKEQHQNTIFLTTGGNISQAAIAKISELQKEFDIKSIISGFDNDISGLSYSLKLFEGLKLYDESERKFSVNWSRNQNDEIEIDFLLKSSSNISPSEIQNSIEVVQKDLFNNYKFEGKIEYYPSLTAQIKFLTVAIKYSENNSYQIQKLYQNYLGTDGTFTQQLPQNTKDWNDVLLGKDSKPELISQHINDMKSERDRIFVNEKNEIVFQRRRLSPTSSVKEVIAKIEPFARHQMIQPRTTLLPNGATKIVLNQLRALYKELFPQLKEEFFKEVSTSGIKFLPVTGEFIGKSKKVLAVYRDSELKLTGEKISAAENNSINAMYNSLLAGVDPEVVSLSVNFDEVFTSTRNNHGVQYDSVTRTFTSDVRFGAIIEGEFIASENINITDHQNEKIQSLLNDYQEGLPTDVRGEEFQIRNGFVLSNLQVAKLNNNKIEYTYPNISNDAQDILELMQADLEAGKDPNKPGYIGKISRDFTFIPAKNFKVSQLNVSSQYQFQNLILALSDLNQKWHNFREKYPEPLYEIKGEDMTLKYNNEPLYQYNPETGALIPLMTKAEFSKRYFHPTFYKALQLFTDNKGVFFNYYGQVKINPETLTLFYSTPDYEIGKVFKHENKYYYYLYNNVPEVLRREMEAMALLDKAPKSIVKQLNLTLTPIKTNPIKEKKVNWADTVPLPYRRFIDMKKKTFIHKSDDQLKQMSPNLNALYMKAFLWHINTGGAGHENNVTKSKFTEKDNHLIYKQHNKAAYYDEAADKVISLIPANAEFLPYYALFERNKVKDPANRVYGEYLAEFNTEEKKTDVKEIEKFLSKIEYNRTTKVLTILNENLDDIKIGYQKDNSLYLDNNYTEFSAVYKDALLFYANTLKLEPIWTNLIDELNPSVKPLSSIEIADRSAQQKYSHNLITTEEGILKSLIETRIFKDRISVIDDKIQFKFLPGENSELVFPFGENWNEIKGKHIWMAGATEIGKAVKLVVAETPEQALLYSQYALRDSINNNTVYLSMLNYSGAKERETIEKFIQNFKIKSTKIVGSDKYISSIEDSLKKAGIPVEPSVDTLTVSQTLEKLQSFFSFYEPDPKLQNVIQGISGHSFFNPAEGLVIFPVASQHVSHRSILGTSLTQSQDPNALWISKPISEAKRIVMLPNVEEALFYMKMNREYISQTSVIAFQNTVSAPQIQFLNELLALPRFKGNIDVGNSVGLQEQLITHGFKMPMNTIIPHGQTTFKGEYQNDFQDHSAELLRKPFESEYLKSRKEGKSMAPDRTYITMQGQNNIEQNFNLPPKL